MKTITIESIKTAIDSDEVFDKACDHFRAACGYPTKEEAAEAEEYDTWIDEEELLKYQQIFNAAILRHKDAPKGAQSAAINEVLQAYHRTVERRDYHRCVGEIRHAMGHVFQDVIKPEILGIPCEACTPANKR